MPQMLLYFSITLEKKGLICETPSLSDRHNVLDDLPFPTS